MSVAAFLLGLLAGCPTISRSNDGEGEGEGEGEDAELISAYAAADCSFARNCLRGAEMAPSRDDSDCESGVADRLSAAQATADLLVDETGACIDQLLRCDVELNFDDPCRAMLSERATVGNACTQTCATPEQVRCDQQTGLCVARAAVGSACGAHADCETDLACSFASRTCVAAPVVGERCDAGNPFESTFGASGCGYGAVCDGDIGFDGDASGICVRAYPHAGDACIRSCSFARPTDLACVVGFCTPLEIVGIGSACDDDENGIISGQRFCVDSLPGGPNDCVSDGLTTVGVCTRR